MLVKLTDVCMQAGSISVLGKLVGDSQAAWVFLHAAVCGLWADCTDPCGLREESGRGEGNERGWRREGVW